MKVLKHYQIVRKLGSGGMGEVHEAFDTVLEREVAVKVVHPHLLDDPKTDERFMNEARAAAKLVHPNIVTIYEIGKSDYGRYIAMEYVDGVPLTNLLSAETELKPETAIKLAIQILSGLHCAHNQGIFHRDIKPDNILVLPSDLAKILDFGIAKVKTKKGLTAAGDILGTVEYMAPEQMLGDKLDHRGDIYATGVVLYQLLTKRLPFTGENPVALLYKVLNEDPVPPSYHNNQVGQDLDRVVLTAISRGSEDRWESAEAFSDALETILRSGTYPSVSLPIEDPDEFPELGDDEAGIIPGEFAQLRSIFVGREKEFRRLVNLFGEAERGQGQTLILRGEAGVGKSTLTERLQKYAAQNDAWVLYGACLYQEGMDAYLPFLDAIRGFFNRDHNRNLSDEDLTEIKTLVRERIPLLYEYTEPFPTISDLSASGKVGSPEKDNLLDAISQFIALLSSKHPITLTIDDLQWGDEATLRLLHYLTHQVVRHRVLLIAIGRTDKYDLQKDGAPTMIVDLLARMRREGKCEEVTLYRLSKESCERLVDKALSPALFTEEFHELIYNETKGNPFFVLETLKLLRDGGGIFFQDGAWYNKQDGLEVSVPDRVEDVFIRRLSALKDEDREILQVAAVCGYRFDATAVSRLAEISKIKLLKILQKIEVELQILASDEQGFRFEHPMLRDLLYKEVPIALSREYHLMIAAEMEQNCDGNRGALVGEIGQHFRRGGNHSKAMKLLYDAGERSFSREAFREAGLFFIDFLDSEERSGQTHLEPEGRTSLYLKLGRCHEETGRWKDSLDAYGELLRISEESNNAAGQVNALKRMGRIKAKSGEYESSLEIYQKSLAIVDSNEMLDQRGDILNSLGIVHFEMGNLTDAERFFAQTIELDSESGRNEFRAHALINLGIIFNMRGQFDQALDSYNQALQTFESQDDLKNQARIYHNIGLTQADTGDWTHSVEAFERCLEMSDSLDDKQLRGLIFLNLGKVRTRQGELVKAKAHAEKALKIFKLMGDIVNVAESYHVFGMIHSAKGEYAEAELFLNQALTINEHKQYSEGLAEVYATFGNIRQSQARHDDAHDFYSKALELFKQLNLEAKVKEMTEKMDAEALPVQVIDDVDASTPSEEGVELTDSNSENSPPS